MSGTLYNYTWRALPSRATPDTPPLAAAMLMFYDDDFVVDSILPPLFPTGTQDFASVVRGDDDGFSSCWFLGRRLTPSKASSTKINSTDARVL